MSKAEILAELPRLSPEERREIAAAIVEIEGDDVLSSEEIAFLEKRLDGCADNPSAFVSWSDAEERLRARLAQ